MKTKVFKASEAAAIDSGAMEFRDHFKNEISTKKLMMRKILRFVLLMSFSITGISLSGQVTDRKEVSTEMISNISEIVECDAKMLGLIFSIGFETINNYFEACSELEKTQNLADFFSNRIKNPKFNKYATPSELSSFNLDMTVEEFGAEMMKRIGADVSVLHHYNLSNGYCRNNHAKKLKNIYLQEIENLIPEYNKAEKALLENEKVIMLIPPDYRYPLALSTMNGFLRNFRASNWKVCVDLYEEQYHRWVMEENSRENIRIQSEIRNLTGQMASDMKKIKRNTAATAIFSGLTYLKVRKL